MGDFPPREQSHAFYLTKSKKMSIEVNENKTENPPDSKKSSATAADVKKTEETASGDEGERNKEQDTPLEIGEHYLVKRGEDSWRKFILILHHLYFPFL